MRFMFVICDLHFDKFSKDKFSNEIIIENLSFYNYTIS